MDHEVHEVNQNPAAGWQTLDVMRSVALPLARLQYMFCQGPDMRVRRSGRDDKVVSGIADPAEVKDHDVSRLVFDQRLYCSVNPATSHRGAATSNNSQFAAVEFPPWGIPSSSI